MKAYHLRGIRRNLNVTQAELGRRVGVTAQTIGAVESGLIGIDEETDAMLRGAVQDVFLHRKHMEGGIPCAKSA